MYPNYKVELCRTHKNAVVPTKGTEDSAGFDLYAVEYTSIKPGETALIATGWRMRIVEPVAPAHAQVCPRSSLALKHSVTVLNAPGIVDNDYRGEVGVILHNARQHAHTPILTGRARHIVRGINAKNKFIVEPGMRIAQLVFNPLHGSVEFVEVDELPETERKGGFGSTGV